ncbi:MAG: NAD(P)H-binding protein [Leeuwenhoekiella sp.]
MGKTAIILGITGVTGTALTEQLFKDQDYDTVVSFHRRKSGLAHPKLEEHIVDPTKLTTFAPSVKADVLFCCVGTTMAKAGSKAAFKKVDYDIPLQGAHYCVQHGINNLIVISAMGANKDSRIFYNQVKGEMEEDISQLDIPKTYFVRPALLDSDRTEKRTAERIAIKGFRILNKMLVGPLKKYRSIKAVTVASAMGSIAADGLPERTISSEVLKILAREG